MFTVDKPDLLIFHGYGGGGCLDGWGCRWCVETKWPDVAVHEGVYGQAPPDVTGLKVLIADFSYPEEVLREMAAQAQEITILDHHEGAREHVIRLLKEGVIKGRFDLARSGASLTYEAVWGSRHAPKLIEHIQDRDLWNFHMEKTREVCAVLYSHGYDKVLWTELGNRLERGFHAEVHMEGAAILRDRERLMNDVIRTGTRTMIIGGVRVPVVNAPYAFASEIGHELAKVSPVGWAAVYTDMDDCRKFSLRATSPEANVHLIAQEYGGNGHPPAAGFRAPLGWEGDVDDAEEPVEAILLGVAGRVGMQEG
jgi:hypothetical protein